MFLIRGLTERENLSDLKRHLSAGRFKDEVFLVLSLLL